MLKEFNELPLEMQSNILRFNPNMRKINKIFYEDTKQYYYDTYCQLPISQNEFMKYINKHLPDQFAIFSFQEENFKVLVFENKGEDFYYLREFTLKVDEIDIDEYFIRHDFDEYHVMKLNNLIKSFQYLYDNWIIYYDVQLTFNIVLERACSQINPQYEVEYTRTNFINNVQNIVFDNNLFSLFNMLSKLMYMYFSYLIYNNNLNDENVYEDLIIDLEDIVFNNRGEIIEIEIDLNDKLNEYEKKYNKYYNHFLNQILI